MLQVLVDACVGIKLSKEVKQEFFGFFSVKGELRACEQPVGEAHSAELGKGRVTGTGHYC